MSTREDYGNIHVSEGAGLIREWCPTCGMSRIFSRGRDSDGHKLRLGEVRDLTSRYTTRKWNGTAK